VARLLLPLLAAPACAPGDSCRGDWCGTLVVVSGGEPASLLPALTQLDTEVALSDLLFVKLADVGPELNTVDPATFVPRLARRWTFEDSLTLRFELDPEARWEDGTPVTASDVAFTFDIYRDSTVNARARLRLDRIASVSAPDAGTAVVRFSSAYPEQFYDAVYHMRVVPRHLLDTIPPAALRDHPFGRTPVGSGPFRLARWSAGEVIDLVADSSFFLGRPGVRRILWRFAPDPGASVTQVLAGEADFLNTLRADDIPRIEAARELEVVTYPSMAYAYLAFNFRDPADVRRPHPLFGDREVRRALSMAVDRDGVVQAVRGAYGYAPTGPLTRALWVWDERFAPPPFDTAAARHTLAERGWRDIDRDGILDRNGRPLAFDVLVPTASNDRQRSAVIIQEQLRRVGVRMTIIPLESTTFVSRAEAGQADAFFAARTDDPSPASVAEAWSGAAIGGANWGRYANPEVDRLMREAMSLHDPETVRARWHAAIQRITEDAPAIWVYAPVNAAAVHERLENVSIRPDEWAATLWTWRVPPARAIARDRLP
jgi:peptide/nickel transport system substrate-binding protein